ncbi:MAG: hypothetical protein RIF46_13475, partial [Cyclobacteriaceae bacterium]
LLEQSILNFYLNDIGFEEILFDRIELIFVPDEVYIPKNQNLKGKLILAATSKSSASFGDMFVQGDSVKIVEGVGLVNLPWGQINNKKRLDALFKYGVNDYPGNIEYKIIE